MKKGFTLIELLAVIVILAIIALIATPIVLNIIDNVKKSSDIQSAKSLEDIVSNYISSERLHGNKITEEQIFVIKNNTEYRVYNYDHIEQTSNFQYKGNLCNYCIVKINPDKEISIFYEGSKHDIKKDYDSDEFIVKEINAPREIVSQYNELVFYKNLYILNNDITDVKYFKTADNKLYELTLSGEEKEIATLHNAKMQGKMKLLNSVDYTITIGDDESIYEFNNEDEVEVEENINSEYSDKILNIYDSLMMSVERYLSQATIDSELYFEFEDSVINKVNEYGKTEKDSLMTLSSNLKSSGEIRINPSKEVSIVIYDTNQNIKTDYGSNKLYSEPIKYSREAITLVKNLSRLELIANEYTSGNKDTSNWLIFYYIRSKKYSGTIYDTVTGTDDNFGGYVNGKSPDLETYFKNTNTYTVNEHKIDLFHLGASIAGSLYDSSEIANWLFEEIEYDCVVSWAGDLHTLMENSILKNGVKEEYGNYLNATYDLMGKSNTSFSMEDVYADIDAWVLYYNIKENPSLSISEIFDKYYSGESSRSYKNRYTSFISIMDTIATQFNSSKVNFEGVASHFTSTAKAWPTIGSLEVTPTSEERKEIADGFVKWIKDQAAKE